MTTFRYTAHTADGRTTEGRQKSRSIGDLRRWMQGRDLVPVSVATVERRWHVEITPARTKRKILVHFTRQLGVFVRSGIPLVEALRVQYEECEDRALRRALGSMIENLVRGETLSRAAARHPEVFPHYFIGLLRAAERTGRLDEALQSLADYLQRDIDTRATIVGALAYPCIVVMLSLVTVAVLTGYVLPQFRPLFAELDAELPAPTRLLLGASGFVTDRALVLVGALVGLLAAGVWSAVSARGRRAIDRWLLRVPVGRQLVQFVILERFCRILATLVQAGIPLPDGLSIGAESTRNTEVRRRLAVARSEMERGRGFAAPLVDTGLFPATVCVMFRVGEETGTLESQLLATSHYLEAELTQRIRRFTGLFEPAMIVGVGLTVGFVAVALVSAMYGVLDGVEQTP